MVDCMDTKQKTVVSAAEHENVYGIPMSKEEIERLDVPDVLKNLLVLALGPPATVRIDGNAYVVGDPDLDAEASVSWDEDEITACALTIRPGRIEFRRRARIEGESAQVEILSFDSVSSDGQEFVDFAQAAGI